MKSHTEYLNFTTKRQREFHEVIVPVTGGKLDFGPWRQI